MSQIIRLLFIAAFVVLFVTACSDDIQKESAQPEAKNAKPDSRNIEGLDLLTNYDRDIWDGPDSWSDKQWEWKKRLRWNKACDYVGEVEVYTISKDHELVKVMCVPGAYQAMNYLFLYDLKSNSAKQLALGAPENTDQPNEIWGHLDFNEKSSLLSIVTLSRGVGDCGVYRVFNFKTPNFSPKLVEKRKRECSEEALPENPPEAFFNPKKWPLVSNK